ncbi:MAG: GDP-mannose 4,6-dehydratase [Phycisphaerae bacterium]|jgi:UDP-glucuronate 4-epimerase|nr:GDP-mannose 4,6-dehydratase [Phycisphaerae bacterium]
MKILVTGVAGFIGSHTASSLINDKHDVVGVDNFDPFYDRRTKESNLRSLPEADNFQFIEADIRDQERMAELLSANAPLDAVLHLAARAGVRPSIQNPVGYEQVNIAGTLNLLQAAIAQNPAPKFVFASSSSVYGNNPKVPFSEDDPVDNPISPYAATKKACELICHTYHHLYQIPITCLRFFTVFGPRQRPDLAIDKFARLILAGEPIEMFGDGSSSRDYTYIDDIVSGVRSAIDRCDGYEIINLGSRHPITLTDMIATVARACGREPIIQPKPMQPGDVNRTFADLEKASRLLDYKPTTPFAEGVARQVEWLKNSMV